MIQDMLRIKIKLKINREREEKEEREGRQKERKKVGCYGLNVYVPKFVLWWYFVTAA